MKLSLLIWSNSLDHLLSWIKKAKSIGYDAVELFPQKISPSQEADTVKKFLNEYKLERIGCIVLPTEADITCPDEKIRGNGVNFLKRCIDLIAKLNGELITGVIYAPWGKVRSASPNSDWDRSAASLKYVCKYASQFGIKLAIEPVNHYRTYLINTAEDAIKFLESVREDNLGIHLDTYHMNIEESDFYKPVVSVGKMLYHVHCSENNRGILGTGHVNWEEFFQALNDVNYQGHLGFEYYTPSVREVSWKRIVPPMEEVVTKSLQFMKEMCNKYLRR